MRYSFYRYTHSAHAAAFNERVQTSKRKKEKEKAEAEMDADKVKQISRKLQKAEFDFNDFLEQLQQIKKMGDLGGILNMLPGIGGMNLPAGGLQPVRYRVDEAVRVVAQH